MANESTLIGSIPASTKTNIISQHPPEIEKISNSSTAFERFKSTYFGETTTMEKSLSQRSLKMSFIVGLITGGFLGHENSKIKFQTYAEGKSFGNARNALVI